MGTNEIDGDMKTAGAGAVALKKGPWTAAEDAALVEYVEKHGEGNWNAVRKNSGLARCGKSCRLRWANHLRPNLKKGAFSVEEERIILELHAKLGNKWARMAAQLPGRTDNEIKNYWNTRVKRRLRQGLPLYPQDIHTRTSSSYHHPHNHNHHQGSHISQTQNLLPTSPSLSPPNQSNNSSSLSLIDVNSHDSSTHLFSTPHMPPLYLSSNRYKRYRSPNVDFSLNQSSLNHQSSSPLGHYVPSPLGQSMFTQLPYVSPFSLGSRVYDQTSSQTFQTQFKSEDGFVPSTSGFTFLVKPELPSNQNYQTTMHYDTSPNDDTKRGMNVANRHGSGLLDDLLQESETISCHGESRGHGSLGSDQEKGMLEGFLSHWDHESSSIPASSEQAEQVNFMHEDLSNILNTMPPTPKLPLWYTNADEISNDQSSVVDNVGIDVQQLTSSNWDNMPGIC